MFKKLFGGNKIDKLRKNLQQRGYDASKLSDEELRSLSDRWERFARESGRPLDTVIGSTVGMALKLGKSIHEATEGFEQMSRFSHQMRDSATATYERLTGRRLGG